MPAVVATFLPVKLYSLCSHFFEQEICKKKLAQYGTGGRLLLTANFKVT